MDDSDNTCIKFEFQALGITFETCRLNVFNWAGPSRGEICNMLNFPFRADMSFIQKCDTRCELPRAFVDLYCSLVHGQW